MHNLSRVRFSLALATLCTVLAAGCSTGGDKEPQGEEQGPPDQLVPEDVICGDGKLQQGEACDDSNLVSGDGCSENCLQVEPNFVCAVAGSLCVEKGRCGNGLREDAEACDDRNLTSGDGCSSSCTLEPGWTCLAGGGGCQAAACGDGIIAGAEECEDGDSPPAKGDGCDASCRFEAGFKCVTAGQPCVATRCGDNITEGTEQCDDGNNDMGDGCSPFCIHEPSCTNGTCTPRCGDNLILPGDTTEQCDDGNLRNNDGCSSTCKKEVGFSCELLTDAPPSRIDLPVVYRDFRGGDVAGGHPDFQSEGPTSELGVVGPLYTSLLANNKPVYVYTAPTPSTFHGASYFNQWYRDTPNVNKTLVSTLPMDRQPNGSYVFDDGTFFPLDGKGWVASGQEQTRLDGQGTQRNFFFTSEVRYWFEFKGTEVLDFIGDDDVWVYINKRLALDLGGKHQELSGTVDLSNPTVASKLGLQVGKIYEAVVFQAERHTVESHYKLTLNNFVTRRTRCVSTCGNGTVNAGEQCDNGTNNGAYGTCNPDCTLPPRCGDSIIQTQQGEECDTGPNGGNGCSKTCKVIFG